jgi:CBS domain-containing protein
MKDDKLVGIVTATDFVRFARRHFETERRRKPPAERANKKAKRRGSSTSRSAKGRKSR